MDDTSTIDGLDQYAVAVDEYLKRSYDGDRRQQLMRQGGWDEGFAAELADLGWFALSVPESHGGLATPLAALGRIFMQLGEHLVIGPSLENLLLPALLRPTDWESAPAIGMAVERGVPLALVDPGVTIDWADDMGSVLLGPDGRLRGHVEAVRFAGQAGLLVVIAASETGSSICLVDPAAEGVTIHQVASADPTAEIGRVVLEDVRPLNDRSAGADDELVSRIRSWARLLIACELSGVARRSLDRTIEHIAGREQFGRAIGSFQAVKHIAASMHARTTGLHNLCLAALADADHVDARQLELLTSAAKAHAADAALRVCEDAIQLQGGMGFTTENELNLYYKRALALRGWYGDEVELAVRVGTSVLDAPRTDDPLTATGDPS